MKFLWESNASWVGTGYGQQTKLMLKSLQELGHTPTLLGFYGIQGGVIEYDGYQCLPASPFDIWGNDVVKAHAERVDAEVIVTLMDLFVLDPAVWSGLKRPWVAWVPIDHDEISNPTLERLRLVNYPVAMSNHGAMEMAKVGIQPSAVIYHAVDTDVMKPIARKEARKELSIDPDCFLIGMVMANKGDRKQFPRQLDAIRGFMNAHPDEKIRIYMHTEGTQEMGGWDIKSLLFKYDLAGKLYMTNRYDASVVPLRPDTMAMIYSAMDVLMNCSAGEGFGIPIVEAQACGIPVITNGVTSMPELTKFGYTTEHEPRSLASHFGFQYGPNVESMTYRLECAYRLTHRHEHGAVARQWVIDNCSVPVIAAQWHELLGEVEENLQIKRGEALAVGEGVLA